MNNAKVCSIKVCSICKNKYIGFGNNAYPINNGRCCDECNSMYVIPARIYEMYKNKQNKSEEK